MARGQGAAFTRRRCACDLGPCRNQAAIGVRQELVEGRHRLSERGGTSGGTGAVCTGGGTDMGTGVGARRLLLLLLGPLEPRVGQGLGG